MTELTASRALRVRAYADPTLGKQPTDPDALAGAICGEVRRGENPPVPASGRKACESALQGRQLAQSWLRAEGFRVSWTEETAVVDFGDGGAKRKQTRYCIAVEQIDPDPDGEVSAGGEGTN